MDERAADPVKVLMERAGLAVARETAALGARYGTRVAVLCGPGNNGGDGYVAARHLRRRGAAVQVHALAEPRTAPAAAAARAARRAGVSVGPLGTPRGCDMVVDALFGGKSRPGLPPEMRPWFDVAVPVVSVDVPTGVDPDTGEVEEGSFFATRTVTFGALKPAHLWAPDRCGVVRVVDIGLGEADPLLLVGEDQDALRPPRRRDAHKWSAGSVLVVGGAAGMVGAAVMAGRAALNFGAGAVGVASPQPELVANLAPELLAYELDDVDAAMDRYGVVVVGPGLGDHAEAVATVLDQAGRVVADADALRSIEQLRSAPCELIVTPHRGELARLTGSSQPDPGAATDLAHRIGGVVVLKGSPTVVADGGVPWVVTTGGPELATIGTGDVLAGMIAALWARGLDPVAAARSGAHWHGVAAADLAGRTTVTADRLARHVGRFAWG